MFLEKEFTVNSININTNKRLGLFGILGMLQDAAETHARMLGFGYDQMVMQNAFWVLVQQKLVMSKWPKWLDQIVIKTWPRPAQGLKAFRDFEIYLAGEKIGECVALFMVLDGKSRRPIRPNVREQNYSSLALPFTPNRIEFTHHGKMVSSLQVKNSDLDMNLHVNNTKYAQWILDAIPIKYHSTTSLEQFEINFMAESYLEDSIDLYSYALDLDQGKVETFFKGMRKEDQKVIFVAKCLGISV